MTNEINDRDYKSAGVIITAQNNDQFYILMVGTKDGLSIPGGKKENIDLSPIDTALRECHEETNGILLDLDPSFREQILVGGPYTVIYDYSGMFYAYFLQMEYDPLIEKKNIKRVIRYLKRLRYIGCIFNLFY